MGLLPLSWAGSSELLGWSSHRSATEPVTVTCAADLQRAQRPQASVLQLVLALAALPTHSSSCSRLNPPWVSPPSSLHWKAVSANSHQLQRAFWK